MFDADFLFHDDVFAGASHQLKFRRGEGGTFSLFVTVPTGATATVRLPAIGFAAARLTLDGKSVPAKNAGRYLEVEVAAGKHMLSVIDSL